MKVDIEMGNVMIQRPQDISARTVQELNIFLLLISLLLHLSK